MYAVGFSIDNISLMALATSVGFVVDDAIVMIENIDKAREAGLSPMQAALRRLEADRLHRHLDLGVADGGVHAAAAARRHPRPCCFA